MNNLTKVTKNTELILEKLTGFLDDLKPKAEAFERMADEYKKIKKEGLTDCHLIQRGDETRIETVFKEGLRLIQEKGKETEEVGGLKNYVVQDQINGGFALVIKREEGLIFGKKIKYKGVELTGFENRIERKEFLRLEWEGYNNEDRKLLQFLVIHLENETRGGR